ncbi:MAG: DsrE family protein [Caldisericia bacterium]|nr:DsrE family protein [Caldisericia bacterium]
MEKTTIILVTEPPYGSAISAEAFRSAMGLPTVNIKTKVILMGDGIFAMLKNAKPKEALDFGHMGEAFLMGEEFDFSTYIHKESFMARGLSEEDLMPCEIIDNVQLETMLREADSILRF